MEFGQTSVADSFASATESAAESAAKVPATREVLKRNAKKIEIDHGDEACYAKTCAMESKKSKVKGQSTSIRTKDESYASTKDKVPCSVCNEKFCDDKYGRSWIQCQVLTHLKWFHNECQAWMTRKLWNNSYV